MMDLTNCIKKKKTFNGANGTKISVTTRDKKCGNYKIGSDNTL